MNNNAIGFFDSGVGGISIWKEVTELLPLENTIYLADSTNAPYGDKTKEEILSFCKKNTEYLLDKNCKIIIVACNTATTNAIDFLRKNYDIPFIGIEPAIKPASIKTKTKSIGILATKGTLNSDLFAETSKKYLAGINVVEQIGEGLVPLIEKGKLKSQEMYSLLEKYINPMLEQNIDCLVLGCSHYPFLIPLINKITNNHVEVIDSGLAVAKQTKNILVQNTIETTSSSASTHQIYSNLETKILKNLIDTKDRNIRIEKTKF